MEIKPFTTTGIGSLPYTSARDAAAFAIESLDVPFWPQLPNRSANELMIPQYLEGMPGGRLDPKKGAFYIERNAEEISRAYETLGPDSRVAITEDFAHGFYAFLEQARTRTFEYLKGHITGPLTFTLGLKDTEGRVVYYDEEMREISMMLLLAKARWQITLLKPMARKGVIIFIDEPILSALGSTAYMGVEEAEASRMLSTVAEGIKAAGGIPGIHCCGRADWPLVLKSGVQVMNFDSYSYGPTLAIYPAETTEYLKAGGYLAWGAVPTLDAEDVKAASAQSVRAAFDNTMNALIKSGVPEALLKKQILLTPACGTGSRTLEENAKIFQLLIRLKEDVQG